MSMRSIKRWHCAVRAAMALALVVCAGCSDRQMARSVIAAAAAKSEEPTAKFTVTAVSHGSWASYRDRLQPAFKAQADSALGMVLATTAKSEQKDLNASRAALNLAFGDATASSPESSELPSAKDLPGIAELGAIDLDPMAKYQLAASLFQEIQLLNSYVQDVAIPHGYRGYVVRLNLGIMSFRAQEPADVYATISFFDGVEGADGRERPLLTEASAELASERGLRKQPSDASSSVGILTMDEYSKLSGHTKVLPMLATDSIEAAMRSRSAEKLRDLAASIGAGFSGVSAALTVQQRIDQIASVLARDYNTTYQVFHDSENSILVKIGAANSASQDRALIGRAFPVSVLLLVPEGLWKSNESYPRINVVAKMTLRDSRTGKVIGSPNLFARIARTPHSLADLSKVTDDFYVLDQDLLEAVELCVARYRTRDERLLGDVPSPLLDADILKMLLALNDNNYAAYRKVLRKYPDLDRFHEEIWTVLLEAVTETGFARTSISLRSECKPHIDRPTSEHPHAVLVDNQKTSSITLGGFQRLENPNKLRAELIAGPASSRVILQSQAVSTGAAGSQLTLQFASLKALGIGIDSQRPNVRVRVLWYDSDNENWINIGDELPAQYSLTPPSPARSPYLLLPTTKVVTAKYGSDGRIRLSIRRDKDFTGPATSENVLVGLRLSGAEPTKITLSNGKLAAIKGGSVLMKSTDIGDEVVVDLDVMNFHASPVIECALDIDEKPTELVTKFDVKVEK